MHVDGRQPGLFATSVAAGADTSFPLRAADVMRGWLA
jgi:hypothetical protein